MGRLTRKRRITYALALCLFALCLVVVMLPLWFPWVLRPALEEYGVHYDRYERRGFGRFVLSDAKLSQTNLILSAGRVEVLLPATLLWRLSRNDAEENYVHVSDWNLQILEAGPEKKSDTSVYQFSEQLVPILAQLSRWLPKAALSNCSIHFDKREILIPEVSWRNGNLTGRVGLEKLLPETIFVADLSKSPRQISWKTPEWNLESKLTTKQDQESLTIDGSLMWESNRIEMAAQFGRDDLLPRNASIQSKSFRVPTQWLNLEGFRELTGSLDARWQTNRFAADLTAQAEPIESDDMFLSAINAEIRLSGDTNAVRIERADVFSPWLQAKLSRNVDFNFRGEMVSPVVTLSIRGDLSQQNWIPAQGELIGEAILKRGEDRYPDATFELSGAGVEIGKLRTEKIDLHGAFEWPWLEIQSAKIQFKEGGLAEGDLRFNAVSRLVADGRVKFDGRMGGQFLPSGVSYDNMALTAEISGPLTNLVHSAHVELQEVKAPSMAPLGIVADWAGTQFNFEKLKAKVSAKNSSLTLSGSLEVQTNLVAARIENLSLATNDQPGLTLEKPFTASWGEVGTNHALHVDSFHWRGDKTEISLDGEIQWPRQGVIVGSVKELNFATFQDFSDGPLPDARIERLNLTAQWTNGPVNFTADGAAKIAVEDGTLFSAAMRASGDGKGIAIEQAAAGNGREAVISGQGFLPVILNPVSQSNVVQILRKERIDFNATTLPNPQFWKLISKWTRATFQDPSGSIAISGTLDEPSGKVLFRAREVLFKPGAGEQPMPRMQDIEVDFDLVRDRIALQRLNLMVEGQPVTATGELPLPNNLETNWQAILDWRKANVHLKIVDAKIAPFERLFPEFLSPLGTVNLDVRAVAGKLEGELRVAGAALRPVPSLGPIHDIEARVRLAGDDVRIETFKGSIGGQPIELTGEVRLAMEKGATLPPFDFKLRGTNVPLAREPELILRSDLDLRVSNKKGGVPLVSGTLKLRDSFYLSDLKELIPGKVAKAEQRPPYFTLKKLSPRAATSRRHLANGSFSTLK